MPKSNAALHGFNRGIVGQQALARVDLERMRLSAETQTNWMPRSVGSMTLRPGTEYINRVLNDSACVDIPFIYSNTDYGIIECTNGTMRPLINDAPITRPSVTTTIADGTFTTGIGWTHTAVGGASATVTGGYLQMECVAIDSYVTTTQTLTIAAGDQNKEHGLRISVARGPVLFKIGSAAAGAQYFAETLLETGLHSIAFTPTGASAYLSFESRLARDILVDSITIEAAGDLALSAFWTANDLPYLRWANSGNDIFLACYGKKQRRIKRYGTDSRSWALVEYTSYDGPFSGATADSLVKLSIDKAAGTATLTASRPFFTSNHVGSKFRLFTPGYNQIYYLAQATVYTPAVRVSGVGAARDVSITVTGTWVGTLTVQKSYTDAVAGFTDTTTTIAANSTVSVTDASDNVIMWVRVGFNAGAYTSGKAEVKLTYGVGSAAGITTGVSTSVGGRFGVCQVESVTNSTTAVVSVLSYFTSSQQSNIWYEGEWSDYLGWPSAVAFHEGRLFWAGRDRLWGSVSDSFYSFTPTQEGDSGPIQRSIGYGPVALINTLVPLSRLSMLAEGSEVGVRSSQFDEPLTPTNFSLKDFSNYGSARVGAVKVDTHAFFVKKGGKRLMEIAYDVNAQDYTTNDTMKLNPDLCIDSGIVQIAVQRQPDTRVHCVRDDGTVIIYIYEPNDEVRCLVQYETAGIVEGVCVLPGTTEDQVYYIVKRVVNGSTVRYREKWALENECIGAKVTKLSDCHRVYSGASTATITGLSHLEGFAVVAWGGTGSTGKDLGSYTVASGQITLSEAVTDCVVGLYYEAQFKSTKLAYSAAGGTALGQKKRLDHISLVLYKTHYQGVRFGRDFDNLDPLPLVKDGEVTAVDTVHDAYDMDMTAFNGGWDTDSRLCIEAAAPRPCTVLAAVISVTTNG